VNDIFVPGLEGCQRAGLIDPHHATVANHVGRQDCGKATLSAFFGHLGAGSNGVVQKLIAAAS
jgi:hypothetical protein